MTEDILRQLESEHEPRQRLDTLDPTLSPALTAAPALTASVAPLARDTETGRALEAQQRAASTTQRRGRY